LTEKHDPWDPHPELVEKITNYMRQVSNQIKVGGSFLHITFAQPQFRQRFIELKEFKVTCHRLGTNTGGFEYFCYEAIKT
jgi:hypothetical protein